MALATGLAVLNAVAQDRPLAPFRYKVSGMALATGLAVLDVVAQDRPLASFRSQSGEHHEAQGFTQCLALSR